MLEFARWKYILVSVVALLALLFASPNFFGEDLALQVARKDRVPIDAAGQKQMEELLQKRGAPFKRAFIDEGRVMVLFDVSRTSCASRCITDGFQPPRVCALQRIRAPAFFARSACGPMPRASPGGGLYLSTSM